MCYLIDTGWREGEGKKGFRNPGFFERRLFMNFVGVASVVCVQVVFQLYVMHAYSMWAGVCTGCKCHVNCVYRLYV